MDKKVKEEEENNKVIDFGQDGSSSDGDGAPLEVETKKMAKD